MIHGLDMIVYIQTREQDSSRFFRLDEKLSHFYIPDCLGFLCEILLGWFPPSFINTKDSRCHLAAVRETLTFHTFFFRLIYSSSAVLLKFSICLLFLKRLVDYVYADNQN